jgi:GNAT superfamily N-acetyltransferase
VSGLLRIEEVGNESLDAALYLLQRFFIEEGFHTHTGEMRSALERMIVSPDNVVFLARRGTKALGVATVMTSVGLEYGLSAELEDLYVLPEARGSGVASALIEQVCSWCQKRGCTTVLVTVTPEGEASHNLTGFYGRRGFANTGRVILERALRFGVEQPSPEEAGSGMTEDSSGILIRPFRYEDQAAARGLILDGLVEHWGFLDPSKNPDLDDIASTYAAGTFLVAWQGDELVGTGALVREAEGVARIVRMSVAVHVRRRGIGTLILEHLCGEAQAAGYAQIVLETTSTWEDAVAFYQRNGFRVIGSRDGDTHFVLDLAARDGQSGEN